MSDEKTLDEALEEMDVWSEAFVKEIEHLSPDEFQAYFRQAQEKLERETGMKLHLLKHRKPEPLKSSG